MTGCGSCRIRRPWTRAWCTGRRACSCTADISADTGAGPQRSAFLSSFFALVGTHGLHVLFGVVWLVVLCVQVHRHGLTRANVRRVACLSMFWHFLDVVWIGVFSFVYLMGTLP